MIDRHDELRQAIAVIGEARQIIADLRQDLDIARARIAELEAERDAYKAFVDASTPPITKAELEELAAHVRSIRLQIEKETE